ncbi:hypothetical protein J5N97_004117 [Dioscorea zingiberensis]|uniref:Protein PLASTID MOVEMENT IMPAIRED 2 n=1 Tax=Dioscorea zingiberensis TaxID=325984 RepID=A0A9D5D5J3_9LILI|nr:hypothetical protein J5N97_004117 [Dioscorea zingiberensis]
MIMLSISLFFNFESIYQENHRSKSQRNREKSSAQSIKQIEDEFLSYLLLFSMMKLFKPESSNAQEDSEEEEKQRRRAILVMLPPWCLTVGLSPRSESAWSDAHGRLSGGSSLTDYKLVIPFWSDSLSFQFIYFMERTRSSGSDRISSVREAISLFGERVVNNGGKSDKLKPHFSKSDESTTGAREIHLAKMDIGRLRENKKCAEDEKARAESELYMARGMAKELARQIEEANAAAMARKLELQSTKAPKAMNDAQHVVVGETSGLEYVQVMQELNRVKQELSKLKLEVSSAVEEKLNAESEIKASGIKMRLMEASAENLRREIELMNEEHVLVELARMEAERELQEIESQRSAEFSRYSKKIEAANNRIKALPKEIQQAQELEARLAVTTSDVDVLQNEMVLVRAMEKNFMKRDPTNIANQKKEQEEEELQNAQAELEVSKKELASYKDQGFQLMSSMDLLRIELVNISKEKEQIEKRGKKADSTVRNLNSKLLKAKSQLESASVADVRAKEIVSNLSAALQQMETDIEAVRRERDQINEESKSVEEEMVKSEQSINSDNERLQGTMKELEASKRAEAAALNKLKTVAERAMRNRVCAHQHNSHITISSSEYDYLTTRAAAAKDVAKKKVAAMQAWVEALKVEEKEMLLKTELAQREIKEICEKEETLVAQLKTMEEAGDQSENQAEPLDAQAQDSVSRARKSIRDTGIIASKRRAKIRRSSVSSANRLYSRSPLVTLRKRRKVMPIFVLFLKGKRLIKQK